MLEWQEYSTTANCVLVPGPARNFTPRWVRDGLAAFGNPADWLATDQLVPLSCVLRIETWDNGLWLAVEDTHSEAAGTRPRCDTRAHVTG